MKKFLEILLVFLLLSEFLAVGVVKAVPTAAGPPENPYAYSSGTDVYIEWSYTFSGFGTCSFEIWEFNYSSFPQKWELKWTFDYPVKKVKLPSSDYGIHAYKLRTKFTFISTTYSDYTKDIYAYVLNKPTGLTVSVNPDTILTEGNSYLTLKWNPVDSNATYAQIWRRVQGVDIYDLRATLTSSSTTFNDTTVLPNVTYEYVINAVRKDDTLIHDDYSLYTAIVSKLTLPAPPTNFEANGIDKTVYMAWSHTKDCDGYKIYKWAKSGMLFYWSLIATLNKNTFSYNTTVTDYGSYLFKVTAYNASGDSPKSPSKTAYALQKPTGLTATTLSSTSMKLTWDPIDTNATQVRVSYSTNGTTYSSLGVFNLPISNVTAYSLTPITQYWFTIAAKRDSNESNYSDPVIAKTLPTGTPPYKPSGFGGVALSCNKIDLVWIDGSSNEDGFKIERKESGGTYAEIGAVSANIVSYSDTTISTGKTYYYRVRAYNSYGNSDYTVEINITIPACDSDIYSTGMITVGGTMSCDLDLGKETGSTDPPIDFFWAQVTSIERHIDPKNGAMFHVLGSVDFDSITHSGLKTYSYSSDNIDGSNNASNQIPAGTVVAVFTSEQRFSKIKIEVYGYDLIIKFVTYKENPPNSPQNLTASAISSSGINLNWTDNSDNESGFKIERKELGGTYTEIKTLTANINSYSDTGLNPNITYYYRIRSYNSFGNSDYSNEANATTKLSGTIPIAPSTLTATAATSSEISLTWKDNSDNEDGFKLERKTEGGSYTEIKTLTSNTTSFTDSSVSPNTTYAYRVRAFNSIGYSDYSNETSVKTPSEVETIEIKLYIDKTTYYVNGVKKELDAAPIIKDSRTLLPIRAVIESLGGTIEWDSKERKVTITFKGTVIELWIGKNTAKVNGEYKLIDQSNPDVKPIIIPPGRTMLPIRFIAENLGCKVDWDPVLKEVKITYPAE